MDPHALRSTAQLVPPAQQGGAGVNLECLGVGPSMSVGVDDVVTVAHDEGYRVPYVDIEY